MFIKYKISKYIKLSLKNKKLWFIYKKNFFNFKVKDFKKAITRIISTLYIFLKKYSI